MPSIRVRLILLRWGVSVACLLCLGLSLGNAQVMLGCPNLTESSGVCVGTLQRSTLDAELGPDAPQGRVIWSHNDSGGKAALFGFSPDGEWLAHVVVEGAKAVDWEDICAFEQAGRHFLAVADVGDNSRRRERVEVYVIEEPVFELPKNLSADGKASNNDIPLAMRKPNLMLRQPLWGVLRLKFDTGPVDCESIAFDPRAQAFLLPSKELLGCRLFSMDATEIKGEQTRVATSRESLFLPMVSGADISPDGRLLALNTYGPACIVRRPDARKSWLLAEGETVEGATKEIVSVPARKQGESICFAADGEHLLLTSEFLPTPLHRVKIPADLLEVDDAP